jgi:hypothetical protein
MNGKVKKAHIAIALGGVGCGSLVLGAALVYLPAGLIVLGVLCLASLWAVDV